MHWLALVAFVVLCSVAASLTYGDGVRQQRWYPFAMAGCSVCGGLLYGLSVRACRTGGETFTLSVAWDVTAAVVWVLVPVLAFGLRVSPVGWLGFALAVAGVLVLKAGCER